MVTLQSLFMAQRLPHRLHSRRYSCSSQVVLASCIRLFCNPVTFRWRFTILGVVRWTQKRNNSTALFCNTVENIQASKGDPLAEVRKGGQFANEFLLCLPILANADPNFHAKCFKATMSQATDEAGQKYLVEEEMRCRDLCVYNLPWWIVHPANDALQA